MRTQQQPIDRARLTVSSIVNTLAVSRAPGPGPRRSVGARDGLLRPAHVRPPLAGAIRVHRHCGEVQVLEPGKRPTSTISSAMQSTAQGTLYYYFFPRGGAWGRLRLSTALVPSNTAFPALPEDVIMKGMFGLAPLRYDIVAHHINLNSYSTPNSVCAAATAPLPGYQATTMASQHVSILCCYTCQGSQGGDGCPADAKDTLGNASFIDHHGGPHRPQL